MIKGKEVFLPFDVFPLFREAPIGKIVHVELVSPEHIYWPELDLDLDLECVLYPERFPLVSEVVHESNETYLTENPAESDQEKIDQEKIDECVLALLQLTLHDDVRAWKGFAFEMMDRLFKKGYILDPRGKAKSVILTKEGLALSELLFLKWFEKERKNPNVSSSG